MENKPIKIYLFLTILILSLLPMTVSYLFLEDIIEGALNIGLNEQVNSILEKSQEDLKNLKFLDPGNAEDYKERFYEIERMRSVYQDTAYTKKKLKNAYISYFSIGFLIILIISLVSAIVLSRKIVSSYQSLLHTYLNKSERLRQLENIDEWQEIAGKLAHEIKNPLTPIEVMVSSLSRAYTKKSPEEFELKLKDTHNIVKQEISKLKDMVRHFSSFARLPDSKPNQIEFTAFLESFITHYAETWPSSKFETDYSDLSQDRVHNLMVDLDEGLFKQVLINILNNASQANPDKEITVTFTLSLKKNLIKMLIINDGKSILTSERNNLFKMYYTTQNSEENVGLGLSVVKKIILEHNGDIHCLDLNLGAGFSIDLPLSERKDHEQ